MNVGSTPHAAASAQVTLQVPNVAGGGAAAEQIENAILKHRQEHTAKPSEPTDTHGNNVNLSV